MHPERLHSDTYTLVTHQMAPERLYSVAGDGYFESFDYLMCKIN